MRGSERCKRLTVADASDVPCYPSSAHSVFSHKCNGQFHVSAG